MRHSKIIFFLRLERQVWVLPGTSAVAMTLGTNPSDLHHRADAADDVNPA